MMWLIWLLCCIPLFLHTEENVYNSLLDRFDLVGISFQQEALLPSRSDRDIYIEMSIFEIELLMKGQAVFCRGSIEGIEVGWAVHCAHCHHLQLSQEEMMQGKINLFDHLAELMPKAGKEIGLVTWQNGINNTLRDFRGISQEVIQRLPEGTLGIGLFNATEGLSVDLFRVCREIAWMETSIVARTRYVIGALIELISQANPDMLWTHVCHSEGGLIARNSIEWMSHQHHELMRKQFICVTLGSIFPLSSGCTRETINYYSESDYVTRHWGWSYFDEPNYRIHILNCLTPLTELDLWAGDHIFRQATYLHALDIAIDELRSRYGFYRVHD